MKTWRRFANLLVERQVGAMEQSFQLMSGEQTEEERKAVMAEIT